MHEAGPQTFVTRLGAFWVLFGSCLGVIVFCDIWYTKILGLSGGLLGPLRGVWEAFGRLPRLHATMATGCNAKADSWKHSTQGFAQNPAATHAAASDQGHHHGRPWNTHQTGTNVGVHINTYTLLHGPPLLQVQAPSDEPVGRSDTSPWVVAAMTATFMYEAPAALLATLGLASCLLTH
jgi:hypothetical protein